MSRIQDIYSLIEDMRQRFGWDKTDTKEFIVKCIAEEANELKQAFKDNDELAILEELADVLMYSFTLAKMYNINLYELIQHKTEIVKDRSYD